MSKKKIDLRDESLEDIVEESAKANAEQPEETKEPVVEETTAESPKEPEKPESHEDVEALKKEIADLKDEVGKQSEKMTEEMVSKLATTFGITKEEEKKDQTPWDKEGRQPTWTEALEYMAEKTHGRIKSELEAEEKQEQEKVAKQQETQQNFNNQLNSYWDTQLKELTDTGRIPAVTNATDDKDEGRVARVALFKTMMEVNQERTKKGLDPITNIKEIFYEHYKVPSDQPAGENAPIAGVTRAVTGSSADKIPYGQFHSQNIEDIVKSG